MLRTILVLTILFLEGCGTAWVVDRRESGGVIGYQGYSSGERASTDIEKLVHCHPYRTVSDTLMDGGTSTSYIPVQSTNYSSGTVFSSYGSANYSGQQTQTNYVPVQVHNYWRALTYACEDRSIAVSSHSSASDFPPDSKTDSYFACNNACYMKYAGEAKKASSCYEKCRKDYDQ